MGEVLWETGRVTRSKRQNILGQTYIPILVKKCQTWAPRRCVARNPRRFVTLNHSSQGDVA